MNTDAIAGILLAAYLGKVVYAGKSCQLLTELKNDSGVLTWLGAITIILTIATNSSRLGPEASTLTWGLVGVTATAFFLTLSDSAINDMRKLFAG